MVIDDDAVLRGGGGEEAEDETAFACEAGDGQAEDMHTDAREDEPMADGIMDGGADEDEERDDAEVVSRALRWRPVPVEAARLFDTDRRARRSVLSSLVGILGNKEYFIREYRLVLAERLLCRVDDDFDDDTRILELLKLKFGNNSLRECEVMLKDMVDSKRIRTNIRGGGSHAMAGKGAPFPAVAEGRFSSVVLSELFWPPLFTGDLRLPPHIERTMTTYAERYGRIKTPRTLHWKRHLGVVDLELKFLAGKVAKQFTVSAAQAVLIMQFHTPPPMQGEGGVGVERGGDEDGDGSEGVGRGKAKWRAGELAEATGLSVDDVVSKAAFWVNSGVLRRVRDPLTREVTYTLVSDPAEHAPKPHAHCDPDLAVMSVEQQMELNMKVYESYIMGMVTNLESLPIEKIHNMLKMFVLEPVYDKTLKELEAFLGKLVGDGKLFFDGLTYRRKRK